MEHNEPRPQDTISLMVKALSFKFGDDAYLVACSRLAEVAPEAKDAWTAVTECLAG